MRANQFLSINRELAKKALGKKGYYSYRTPEGKELIRLARIDLPYSKKTGNLDIWMTLSRYFVNLKH